MLRYSILAGVGALVLASCAITDDLQTLSDSGRHRVPVRINDKLVIMNVSVGGYSDVKEVITMDYQYGGRRRKATFQAMGDTDGYFTYLGRQSPPNPDAQDAFEKGGAWDGPILDEKWVETADGVIIVVAGNTVWPGEIRVRANGAFNLPKAAGSTATRVMSPASPLRSGQGQRHGRP